METTIVERPDDRVARLRSEITSEAAWHVEFGRLAVQTADDLMEWGALFVLAEERGYSVTDVPTFYQSLLRRIGHADVSAKAYLALAQSPLRKLVTSGTLSVAEQDALASDEPVKVFDFQFGEVQHRLVEPSKLTVYERKQVFGRDGTRDAAGQRSYLETKRKKGRRKPGPGEPYVVDRRRRVVVLTEGCELGVTDLLNILRDLERAE